MTIGNEHWSGPEESIQRSAEARDSEDSNQAAKILEEALKTIHNLGKGQKQETRSQQEHWSGPDDLLGR